MCWWYSKYSLKQLSNLILCAEWGSEPLSWGEGRNFCPQVPFSLSDSHPHPLPSAFASVSAAWPHEICPSAPQVEFVIERIISLSLTLSLPLGKTLQDWEDDTKWVLMGFLMWLSFLQICPANNTGEPHEGRSFLSQNQYCCDFLGRCSKRLLECHFSRLNI